jgi:YjbE family integral membrane protein
LQAGGALLLIWIAVKLMMQKEHDPASMARASTIWGAVNTILIADFVMSLDNVLAIAGLANGDLSLIVIGIILSIPIVVWGSGMISRLLQRFPLLLYIGAGILAFTAGEMLIQDSRVGLLLAYWMPYAHSLLPIIVAGFVVLIGGLQTVRRTGT